MEAKPEIYIPYVLRCFQGFKVKDYKEWQKSQLIEVLLEREPGKRSICCRCLSEMGSYKDQHRIRARHLRMMGWTVEIVFWREKRHCPVCKKTRSEEIDFICPKSPHITKELAWWINRLSELTSVLSVSRLESIDKMLCYSVDKYILTRLLQGYRIPKVTHIAVDEVYARGPKQLKEGENRDDLFLTVIVDIRTHKVIWVSQSRKRAALDEFFTLLGEESCKGIQIVATDQHDAYTASVKTYCPNAVVVLDRFHLVQRFNEALNEDRKEEAERIDPEGQMEDLIAGKYRYVFLTKATKRRERDKRHIAEVMRLNHKMARLEVIKEHFHKMFECNDRDLARVMLAEIYQWALDAKANNVFRWVLAILKDNRFWNYFEHKFSTGLAEGINRAIKGLKWQAYGYKDMAYFKLKILQKCGYLNTRFILTSHLK